MCGGGGNFRLKPCSQRHPLVLLLFFFFLFNLRGKKSENFMHSSAHCPSTCLPFLDSDFCPMLLWGKFSAGQLVGPSCRSLKNHNGLAGSFGSGHSLCPIFRINLIVFYMWSALIEPVDFRSNG